MRKIVIVPSLIKDVLCRQRMSIKDVLSYSKLCEILAPADLSAFLKFQSHGAYKDYLISESDSCALLDIWRQGCSSDQADSLELLVRHSAETSLDKDYFNHFLNSSVQEEKSFEVIQSDFETILLVINKNISSNQDYTEQNINIVENILRLLYGEFVQEEIARLPIFMRYVNMLSKK